MGLEWGLRADAPRSYRLSVKVYIQHTTSHTQDASTKIRRPMKCGWGSFPMKATEQNCLNLDLKRNIFPTYDRKSTDLVAYTHPTTYIFALLFSFVYKLW
jgi:hypothetical protein